MRASVIVSIVIPADEKVTMDLLLERSEKLKGLTVHGFDALDVHEQLGILGKDDALKLARFHVNCEGSDELMKRLLEESADFSAGDE
jgi:hypothetical protein